MLTIDEHKKLPLGHWRHGLRKPFQRWPKWALMLVYVIAFPVEVAIYACMGLFQGFLESWDELKTNIKILAEQE